MTLLIIKFALDTGSTHGFPLAVSDGHVAGGLSSVTYEAIITSCWVWLALYKICGEDSYNHRAVSTLCNESFNLDMLRIDKDGTSAPKAANIAKILTIVTALLNQVTQATHQYTETWHQLPASPITKKESWKIPDEKYFSWYNQIHRNASCVEALHSMTVREVSFQQPTVFTKYLVNLKLAVNGQDSYTVQHSFEPVMMLPHGNDWCTAVILEQTLHCCYSGVLLLWPPMLTCMEGVLTQWQLLVLTSLIFFSRMSSDQELVFQKHSVWQ